MFGKLCLFSVLIVYMTIQVENAQELRFRRSNADCTASLAAQPDTCCKLPLIFEESILTKCKADFGKQEPPPPPAPGVPPPGCCVAECVLNTTKIIVDGKFDKNQATTIIKASTKDPKWVEVITAAVDTCEKEQLEMISKMPSPIAPSDPANNKCNPVSGAMIACVMGTMFQNCPDYSSEANCATLKKQIVSCPTALMKKP